MMIIKHNTHIDIIAQREGSCASDRRLSAASIPLLQLGVGRVTLQQLQTAFREADQRQQGYLDADLLTLAVSGGRRCNDATGVGSASQ